MSHGDIAVEIGRRTGRVTIDGDRLDPMDGVLQLQMRTRCLRDIQRGPGVGGFCADVQKEGTVWFQNALYSSNPFGRPLQIALAGQGVVIGAIANAKIVRRRGNQRRNGRFGDGGEDVEAVSEIKPKRAATSVDEGVRSWKLVWLPRVRHRAFSVARPM